MRARLKLPEQAVVAGVIARLTEQKGHSYLFDAIANEPDLAGLHLVVVGDGPLRAALEQQVGARRLSDRVSFLGSRRDLGDLLAAMDIFVLPSLWEGLPLSLVLAMGAGLPVVSTKVAGIPEVVRDGLTGLLVPPADSTSLGQALKRLVQSPGERRSLGAAAREYVLPRFGVEKYVASVISVYDRLLATKLTRRVA